MTLRAVDSPATVGITPVSYTPTVSDTIGANDIAPFQGAVLRVATTGTAATLTIVDPSKTPAGDGGTSPTVALPGTGTRYVLIPLTGIDPATNTASYTLSTTTGISCELIHF